MRVKSSEHMFLQCFVFQASEYFMYKNIMIKANRKRKQIVKLHIKIQNSSTAERIKMIREILNITQ